MRTFHLHLLIINHIKTCSQIFHFIIKQYNFMKMKTVKVFLRISKKKSCRKKGEVKIPIIMTSQLVFTGLFIQY